MHVTRREKILTLLNETVIIFNILLKFLFHLFISLRFATYLHDLLEAPWGSLDPQFENPWSRFPRPLQNKQTNKKILSAPFKQLLNKQSPFTADVSFNMPAGL